MGDSIAPVVLDCVSSIRRLAKLMTNELFSRKKSKCVSVGGVTRGTKISPTAISEILGGPGCGYSISKLESGV